MPLAVIIPMRLYHILLIYGKNRVNGDIRFRKNKQHLVAVNGSNVRYGRLPYYHYKGIKNISDDNLKYTKIATEYVGIEGGGGYYDANSGGYDVLDSVH